MDIPVNIQVYRCYGIVRELLESRGYNIDGYPLLTIEQIQQTHGTTNVASPVPPIIVPLKDSPTLPFGPQSREHKELEQFKTTRLLTSAFQKRYPLLSAILESSTDFPQSELNAILSVYRRLAKPITEVHFHQCFNPENLWGANSRDQKFKNEMHGMVESMETTVRLEVEADIGASPPLTKALNRLDAIPLDELHEVDSDIGEALMQEWIQVFKRARTLIFLFRTRSKASATLDKKYEPYCADIMTRHQIFVQLFNVRTLMFNVTKHEIVPNHRLLDNWTDSETLERIKRTYNMQSLSKNNPVIPLNDPVAKFIGLRRGQLCEITRTNQTSGTYVTYRYCK